MFSTLVFKCPAGKIFSRITSIFYNYKFWPTLAVYFSDTYIRKVGYWSRNDGRVNFRWRVGFRMDGCDGRRSIDESLLAFVESFITEADRTTIKSCKDQLN